MGNIASPIKTTTEFPTTENVPITTMNTQPTTMISTTTPPTTIPTTADYLKTTAVEHELATNMASDQFNALKNAYGVFRIENTTKNNNFEHLHVDFVEDRLKSTDSSGGVVKNNSKKPKRASDHEITKQLTKCLLIFIIENFVMLGLE